MMSLPMGFVTIPYKVVPAGETVIPDAGDIIMVRNRTFISRIISLGEWLRFHHGRWSHTAFCLDNGYLIEALWSGTKRTRIDKYKNVEYCIVKTGSTILKADQDLGEALVYAMQQLHRPYGYLTLIGTTVRFLVPGRGFAFIGRTDICSGLVAQALVRGRYYPSEQPVTISPTELAESLGIPA